MVVTSRAGAYRKGMTTTDPAAPSDLTTRNWFFCGIGGSGMLPLALILRGMGAQVAGSDRSRDQGRTPEKFAWLETLGFKLFAQDGSGLTSAGQVLVASAAVEDTVPEVVKAKALGCERMSRAELLSRLFNASAHSIAVGGTSGKSTVTGMIGWILTAAGRDPTIMNGAVMKNFVAADAPFASARVGSGGIFVSEVDESDGSIALYEPLIAVLNNVSLDHKSLEELHELFGDFLGRAAIAVINADDPESLALVHRANKAVTFGFAGNARIFVEPGTIAEGPTSISATVIDRNDGAAYPLTLKVPGRHNLANALAALAAAQAAGVPLNDGVRHLAGFSGLARRFDIVGTSAGGITVIDDFGHNPEKVAATLATLKAHPGRVIAFFQPHGYGPLRQMGHELAEVLATRLSPEDVTILCDPVYFGGTVDRSVGSERIVGMIREHGGQAEYLPSRDDCADRIVVLARPGDRIVIMGARDDTLSLFARDMLARLP
ncbi:UDP-N-acetylmuramate--L-alanine ligase [Novosphingobium subterraneum]|uniref:UDP-N-acetylmuramate--L-alanine ligase n=2 Tax=Novosphingobium subterraneum TaxID=48936 RepID=A0A0B8ZHM5_9SPHN|nr:UDP-N-acetylmuramate--L-alanine ligase [Novosphingobium subterraneum]